MGQLLKRLLETIGRRRNNTPRVGRVGSPSMGKKSQTPNTYRVQIRARRRDPENGLSAGATETSYTQNDPCLIR